LHRGGSKFSLCFMHNTSIHKITLTKTLTLNFKKMGNILTWVAVILIILWLIGYVGFGEAVGSFIHVLLVLAVIAILIRLFSGRRVM
jgi:hypothetical protein